MQPCRRCGRVHDAYVGCTAAGRLVDPARDGDHDDRALVGNVVADRYHIRQIIGAGSNGTVFRAEHVTFARPAAMKVLRPRFATAELTSRVFHGEARAAWTVSHPCLCEVFDIGTLPDGAPFFVMEHLDGETLAGRIGRERLSLAAAVDVLMQMLSAIAAIHARDLLLRDLRPQNIHLVHRRGCRPLLKILDFGLARLIPLERLDQEWTTGSASRHPTPPASTDAAFYLSPERTRGEHAVEPASDLFVAAAIFYEALTGARPFPGSSWNELVAALLQERAVPLDERRPDVSGQLSAFVARCLASDPRQRPSSAKEMQDEVRAIFEGARRPSGSPVAVAAAGVASPAHDARPSRFPSISAPPSRSGGSSRPPSGAYARTADEASAESPDRTVPPPPNAGAVEVTFDDNTERTIDLRMHGAREAAPGLLENEEEETETMELTPELRAQVDQLMATKPAPVPVGPAAGPKPRRS